MRCAQPTGWTDSPKPSLRTRCIRSTSSDIGGARVDTSSMHWQPAPGTRCSRLTSGCFSPLRTEYGEARAHLDSALNLDPHSAIVHFLVAAAACVMGDPSSASRHAAQALELQPESMGARWPQTIRAADCRQIRRGDCARRAGRRPIEGLDLCRSAGNGIRMCRADRRRQAIAARAR